MMVDAHLQPSYVHPLSAVWQRLVLAFELSALTLQFLRPPTGLQLMISLVQESVASVESSHT